MSRILVSTKDMPRETWLQYRRRGIGGSDAGAIVGLNPFATPYTVWADKTGRLPPKEQTESMRLGNDLEPYVVRRFEEATGKRARRRNVMFQHDTVDIALADIDREIIGENAGLECKTTSIMNLKKFKNGEFPDTYYSQCVHYLAVTGFEKWYLAVLVLNEGFYTFEIQRDEAEIAALLEAEQDFWKRYVETDTPPPMDGMKPTTNALGAMYPGGESDIVGLTCFEAARNYMDLRQQIKALETEKERWEQVMKKELGDYEQGDCGDYAVSWKSRERQTFDVKAFQAAHPEIDLGDYYKTTKARAFSVKELRPKDE